MSDATKALERLVEATEARELLRKVLKRPDLNLFELAHLAVEKIEDASRDQIPSLFKGETDEA